MNNKLLIMGSNSFFSKAILNHIYKNKKKYIKKFSTIILYSRKINLNPIILILKKYFKIIILEEDIFTIKSIPEAKYIIYCLLVENFAKDFEASKRFIKLVKNYKIKSNIIYTSSGAVYGPNCSAYSKIKENSDNKNFLRHKPYKKNYSINKLKSERLFKKLKILGFKIMILRCFSFVGKDLPNNKNYVIKDFVDSVIKSKTIFYKSKGEVIRSYMHQDDLARWLLHVLFNIKKNFSIYNFGSDNPLSIHNLAKYLAKKYKLNYKSNFIRGEAIDNYIPDIGKIKKDFKLKLNFDSINAIIQTILDIKKYKIK